ncbi:MAG: ABC transporter ATP-binding protein [Candidatus Aenigmarchaeota archaeon]|nr:ABC transporter ATP-binding protein [Candidatus Aenigmarchaeota archaeon]
MKAVIEARGLTKKFGPLAAVNNTTFSVSKGELFGLLGANGSGKTTMIKMLTGQIKPTRGKASVLGLDVLKDPIGVRAAIGVMPEQENPPSFLTAEEYLHFAGSIRRMEKKKIKERCDEWFKRLRFQDQRTVLCKDLSRGTRQKLMFAQCFMHEPEMVFIDEPLINLDPVIQKKVKDYLRQYTLRGGTVFFSTHVLEIAEEICTSIGVLDQGKLIYQGKMNPLLKKRKRLESFFLELVGG